MNTMNTHHDQPHRTLDPVQANCTARIIIPTFNAEFIPEHDAGPCHKPAVLRVTIHHDGTNCGCHGLCLDPDLNGTDQTPVELRTEVMLLCADDALAYRAEYGDQPRPGVTVEDLS